MRKAKHYYKKTSLAGYFLWWAGEDLNLRRRKPADLQSALVDHLSTDPLWSHLGGSNPGPSVYKTGALPTELRWHVGCASNITIFRLKVSILTHRTFQYDLFRVSALRRNLINITTLTKRIVSSLNFKSRSHQNYFTH